MTSATGLTDTFARTVAAGSWGTADSGQTYTLQGNSGNFAVSGGFGTITPNTTGSSNSAAADLKTADFNTTTSWQVSTLPGSGTLWVGCVGRYTNTSNYYRAYASVGTAGAVTVVIDRVVGGVITNLLTSATIAGLTVAANTTYGFRFAGRYNPITQTMNLFAKVWSGTEPYGWSATVSESLTTAPPAGTLTGTYARTNDAAAGAVFRFSALSTANHALPFPASADTMCADPAYAYPKQTVAQSLATAIDTYMGGTIAPDVSRTVSPTWVRISRSNWSSVVNGYFGGSLGVIAFDTVEYNSGTPTDLTVDPTSVYLGTGIWMVRGEILVPGSTDMNSGSLFFQGINGEQDFRVDSGTGAGGTPSVVEGAACQIANMIFVSSGVSTVGLETLINSTSGNTSVNYLALTAVKLSDYF